jgi:D-alanyl-D-alanine carboxypeptidase
MVIIMDYLVLVNKENRIPDNWEENISLINIVDVDGEKTKLEKETLDKFYELRQAAKRIGLEIEINSAYRSVERQEEIAKELETEKGPEYVQLYVATPGYSEHHTGLAVDVALRQNGQKVIENEEGTVKLQMYEKLHTILADHGFILRYPRGKEEITGYRYEPWHIRYIQDIEKAHDIMDNNECLEEYLLAKRFTRK